MGVVEVHAVIIPAAVELLAEHVLQAAVAVWVVVAVVLAIIRMAPFTFIVNKLLRIKNESRMGISGGSMQVYGNATCPY